ncbi:MAG TPA: type II toxin-antitoxin system VapC family toxin [Solirubrobacterales bacterium]|nr:type II toxin-antitoxin system VapC family toxin [Solirubrobacterales bacterium]
MATLVDSNVLIDVLSGDSAWGEWSSQALAELGSEGSLVINPVIYAEVSQRYSRKELLDHELPADVFLRASIPWPAAFLAGKAFVDYRQRGGQRRSPLPDFFIGAHAAVSGLRLLTRDASRYRTYFPSVDLVAPG